MKLSAAEIKTFNEIIVIPFDMDKITKEVNNKIQESKAAPENDTFSPQGKYGLIKGTNIIIDKECVGEILAVDNLFTIPFYGSSSIFPRFNPKFLVSELVAESLPHQTLQEFMGDRFAYNSRILSNMKIILKEINKSK